MWIIENIIYFSALVNKDQLNVPKNQLTDGSLKSILEVVFGVFAGIAVLVITIGALKFVLSRGNPQEVAKARDTIIYAAVGLAVSLLAFTIVAFVLEAI